MRKVLFDPETRSYWSGNARVQFNETLWKMFLALMEEKQKSGEIKLVNFPELRSHPIEIGTRITAF